MGAKLLGFLRERWIRKRRSNLRSLIHLLASQIARGMFSAMSHEPDQSPKSGDCESDQNKFREARTGGIGS
jgi:hypothetical protein